MVIKSKYYIVSELKKKDSDETRLVAHNGGKVMFPDKDSTVSTGVCKVSKIKEMKSFSIFTGEMVEHNKVTYEQIRDFVIENKIVPNGVYITNLYDITLLYSVKGIDDEYNPVYPLISVGGKLVVLNWSALISRAEKTLASFSNELKNEYIQAYSEEVTKDDAMLAAVKYLRDLTDVKIYDKTIVVTTHNNKHFTYYKYAGMIVDAKSLNYGDVPDCEYTVNDVVDYMVEHHIGFAHTEHIDLNGTFNRTIRFNNLSYDLLLYDAEFYMNNIVAKDAEDDVNKSWDAFCKFRAHCSKNVSRSSIFQLSELSDKSVLRLETH